MVKETDHIWAEIGKLRKKYSDLCAKVGTVEGKIDVILGVGTITLIAVLGIIITSVIGGR